MDRADVRAYIERERHFRAVAYVLVSFGLACIGYYWLGFDRTQAVVYCVSTYLVLVLLNRRALLAKTQAAGSRDK